VHGVKLDRSFAMSPTDSILGRMLVQVLEMVRTSGRLIVVEGVETEARLNLLRLRAGIRRLAPARHRRVRSPSRQLRNGCEGYTPRGLTSSD
jgi:hypothetical protein